MDKSVFDILPRSYSNISLLSPYHKELISNQLKTRYFQIYEKLCEIKTLPDIEVILDDVSRGNSDWILQLQIVHAIYGKFVQIIQLEDRKLVLSVKDILNSQDFHLFASLLNAQIIKNKIIDLIVKNITTSQTFQKEIHKNELNQLALVDTIQYNITSLQTFLSASEEYLKLWLKCEYNYLYFGQKYEKFDKSAQIQAIFNQYIQPDKGNIFQFVDGSIQSIIKLFDNVSSFQLPDLVKITGSIDVLNNVRLYWQKIIEPTQIKIQEEQFEEEAHVPVNHFTEDHIRKLLQNDHQQSALVLLGLVFNFSVTQSQAETEKLALLVINGLEIMIANELEDFHAGFKQKLFETLYYSCHVWQQASALIMIKQFRSLQKLIYGQRYIFNLTKQTHSIEYFYYLLTLPEYRDHIILRRLVLRSIVFNTLSPFYEIVFDENVENYIPTEYQRRQKTVESSEILEFKNDLLLLLNFLTHSSNRTCCFELTKILGFFLRKPIQQLISDLYLEEKRIELENQEAQQNVRKVMLQQFAINLQQRQHLYDQDQTDQECFNELMNPKSIFCQVKIIVSGLSADVIQKHHRKQIQSEIEEYDQFISLCLEVLTKLYIQMITFSLSQSQTQENQQQNQQISQRQKDQFIIVQLLNLVKVIVKQSQQVYSRTMRAILNISEIVLSKNLPLHLQLAGILSFEFLKTDPATQLLILDFIIQNDQNKPFLSSIRETVIYEHIETVLKSQKKSKSTHPNKGLMEKYQIIKKALKAAKKIQTQNQSPEQSIKMEEQFFRDQITFLKLRFESEIVWLQYQQQMQTQYIVFLWECNRIVKANQNRSSLWSSIYLKFLDICNIEQSPPKIRNREDTYRRKLFLSVPKQKFIQYQQMSLSLVVDLNHFQEEEIIETQQANQRDRTESQVEKNSQNFQTHLLQRFMPKYNILEKSDQKLIFAHKALYVREQGIVQGYVALTKTYFLFSEIEIQSNQIECLSPNQIRSQIKNPRRKNIFIPLQNITYVFTRRYQLNDNAFEIFTDNLKVYFISVLTEQALKIMMEGLQLQKTIQVIIQRREDWRQRCLTQRWVDGELSNYKYLMLINTYSGRTFNDLSQYPIFPCIFKKIGGSILDLKSSEIYRPLDRTIHDLNDDCPDEYISNFNTIKRLKKQTQIKTLEVSLENLDHELTPDYYTMNPLLQVSQLPNYVGTNTVEQLIYLFCQALESEHVSSGLDKWIDNIFGHRASYKGLNYGKWRYSSKDIQAMKEKLTLSEFNEFAEQIQQYGEVPYKLWQQNQHPLKFNKAPQSPLIAFKYAQPVGKFPNPIVFTYYVDGFLVTVLRKEIFTVRLENKITSKRTQKDFKIQMGRGAKWYHFGDVPQLNIDNLQTRVCLMNVGFGYPCLALGGFLNNSVIILGIRDLKQKLVIQEHSQPITCLNYCDKLKLLFLGCEDGQISAWKIFQSERQFQFLSNNFESQMGIKQKFRVYQKAPIVQIQSSEASSIMVSLNYNNEVHIHSIIDGALLQKFKVDQSEAINQMKILDIGFIVLCSSKFLAYTFNGKPYVNSGFLSQDPITQIELINQFGSEMLISTKSGELFIICLFQILQVENEGGCPLKRYLKRKFLIDELEVKMENKIHKKVKEIRRIIPYQKEMCTSGITQFSFCSKKQARVILVGYGNGEIVTMFEDSKQY